MQCKFGIYCSNLLIVIKLKKILTMKNVMFLKRTHCNLAGCCFYSSVVDVSSGFLNALMDVKMYSVFGNREQYRNFINIKQLRIKNQMALYWLWFWGLQTFGNLIHRLWKSQISQGCLKSVSGSLVLNCQRIQEIIGGIFRTIQFQMHFYSVFYDQLLDNM